jgi:hypothetical protein
LRRWRLGWGFRLFGRKRVQLFQLLIIFLFFLLFLFLFQLLLFLFRRQLGIFLQRLVFQ